MASESRIVAAGRGEGIESRPQASRNTCTGFYWFSVKDQEKKSKDDSQVSSCERAFRSNFICNNYNIVHFENWLALPCSIDV